MKASDVKFDNIFVLFLTGMEQGLDLGFLFNNIDTLGEIQISSFNLTTQPCLPVPKPTCQRMIGWIIFIGMFHNRQLLFLGPFIHFLIYTYPPFLNI